MNAAVSVDGDAETTANGKVVGTTVPRADGDAKVRGIAMYGMDYTEPGALTVRVLRSSVPAARIVRLDTSKAASLPGVRAVATAADTPGTSGMLVVKDQSAFAREDVRYVGEPIAAVAADTPAQADAAVAAIELETRPLEPVFDLDEALAEGTRHIHPGWSDYEVAVEGHRGGNLAWEARVERGDVDAAFAEADYVVTDEYRTPRQHQTSIEPHAAVARYENGRYTVHTPTQFPFMVRDRVAEHLGVRPSQVRVVVTEIGGGFGGKLDAMLEPIACVLARKAGRPVRLVNSRTEEQTTCAPRENAIIRLRTAVSRDGTLLAQEAEALSDNGANSSGETVLCANVPALVLGSTYRIANVRYSSKVVYTNTAPTAAFRGVNGPYSVFAREMHLDHIAAEIGMDRRELRMKNLLRTGDTMINGQELDDACLDVAMDRLNEIAPWGERRSEDGRLRGIAVVPATWLTNPGPSAGAVRLSEDGSVVVTSGAVDIGTGALTGIRQIVADELGVPFDQVLIAHPDTDTAGFDNGAQGSRTTFGMGAAALDAATRVREQVLEAAAGMLEVSASDLELAEGHVAVRGVPDRRVSLAAVAGTAMWTTGPIGSTGKFAAPPVNFDAGCMTGALFTHMIGVSYHAHLAEVEVDPDTGKVTVTRYAVVQDVGRAINPGLIEGQVHGAVAQGLGYALYEDLRLRDGVVIDTGLESYRLPTALDIPPIETELLENPGNQGPLGIKGAAEPPIVPVAAVVACAVADAIGSPINSLPLTPFSVLAALRGRDSRDESSRSG
ncbi:xanthine dehydrogenase family protein molybdopterin-binding subunit [Haloechinothrix halophila]|uniref:xanthine dehydrogenase family protein molybdopterin-binding subunit n=1 Tax=Haloechinothrix halophila TaxID=1069073 RepID=UPI00041DA6FA|nr:xanthine dehydrogenase family protein molybdopterin-binding subunit [Haloechinothrix halophila]